MVPAQFRVLVTRRPKYACRKCEDGVLQAQAPARLIEGGLPTEATVAQVLVSKYADHLPLYRQAQIYARARWRDCPREYGPYTTIYNRFNRWAKRGRWCAIFEALAKPGEDRVALSLDSTSIKAHRGASGGKGGSVIRRSAARAEARTTKIHALSDPLCRPVVLHLTPGQDADIAAAPDVLALDPPMRALLADKGYDGDNLRGEIVRRCAKPVIPNKSNRVVIHRRAI
jgi:transposase